MKIIIQYLVFIWNKIKVIEVFSFFKLFDFVSKLMKSFCLLFKKCFKKKMIFSFCFKHLFQNSNELLSYCLNLNGIEWEVKMGFLFSSWEEWPTLSSHNQNEWTQIVKCLHSVPNFVPKVHFRVFFLRPHKMF